MKLTANRHIRSAWNNLYLSLGFKVVFPAVAVIIFLGVGLYGFALRSVSDFASERIREDLDRTSREVFGICDLALQSLLASGQSGNVTAEKIKRGEALGDIETYAQQNNLIAIIYTNGNKSVLFTNGPESVIHNVMENEIQENQVIARSFGNKTYYIRHFQFELWNWHIVLLKDGEVYATLFTQVSHAYLGSIFILTTAGLLLMSYLNRITKAEMDLKAAKDTAERANLAKSRFLAAASHDLRQPMHTVSLLTGLLRERSVAPEDSDLIDKLKRAVNAMEKLFESLLEISRLDADAIKPKISQFPVSHLLKMLEANYEPLAASKGLRFRVIPCAMKITSDPLLLMSIVGNLVSNAIRYTKKGKILIGCKRHGEKLIIKVIDTGIGIPKEHFDDIFDEFVQLLDSRQERNNGLGLGLSIAKRYGDLLGHSIRLQSVLGGGSMFCVEVPCATETPTSTLTSLQYSATTGQLKGTFIAIISDDPLSLSVVDSLCKGWGGDTLASDSIQSIKNKLPQHIRAPDIIISDSCSGYYENHISIIQEIRNLIGEHIPAILLTSDIFTADNEKALASDGIQPLLKPVNADLLRAHCFSLIFPEQPLIR